ncbi:MULTISPECIES: AAA family ATPase [Pseudomonas]|uniref:AAA-type ATPase domain protein n=1 Tax=Pseudomonas fulva TaxID=47880 RepID=A0A0D0JR39_9PSED|nr:MULTISPECIES: AAA family ATPase [Pseudomonas]KIP88759.1 AAA-type ATPase domain protein [Pseudomonas fulva]
MKVIYEGRPSRRTNVLPEGKGDVLELLSNNWNDFGYETTFIVSCRIGGERIELAPVRILLEGVKNTRRYLDKLLSDGWDGRFPIPDVSYISTPGEIAFYEQLQGALSKEGALDISDLLRDASYLVHIKDSRDAQKLIRTEGFKESLQRERGSIESFVDGWKVLDQSSITAMDIPFTFKDVFNNQSSLSLKFSKDRTGLPREINVLIGANGTGKSQFLHQMVDAWLADGRRARRRHNDMPESISRLIVASYSPFELFPVDMGESKVRDRDAYKYFGLRGRLVSRPANESKQISSLSVSLSREIPRKDTVMSMLDCIADDQQYRHIKHWGQKVKTATRVLQAAIDFDTIALKVKPRANSDDLVSDGDVEEPFKVITTGARETKFALIDPATIQMWDSDILAKSIDKKFGLAFVKGERILALSSGQRLFAYLVINLLGAIKRNSLILIDEPELFLHPSLEVQLVDMLKQILDKFNSRAILATHSVSIVREMPSDCVHVFERTKDKLVVKNPPFQTFGGDVQRIASYVFGDKSVSKPFEQWISDRLENMNADELIKSLKGHINEELIIQIHSMETDKW